MNKLTGRGRYSPPMPERFYSKLQPEPMSGCLLWLGAIHKNGYGYLFPKGKNRKCESAHRVAFELAYGEIPDGLFVCHRCDVPVCVNPHHLFLGTARDNNEDCREKGRDNRGGRRSGEDHPFAIMNWEAVKMIRNIYGDGRLRIPGKLSAREIAKRFGFTYAAVIQALEGLTWRTR